MCNRFAPSLAICGRRDTGLGATKAITGFLEPGFRRQLPGLLWTPGYWGWVNGNYAWNGGYWGPHVGFYGGVNYGFGFGGVGFGGGEWRGGHSFTTPRS